MGDKIERYSGILAWKQEPNETDTTKYTDWRIEIRVNYKPAELVGIYLTYYMLRYTNPNGDQHLVQVRRTGTNDNGSPRFMSKFEPIRMSHILFWQQALLEKEAQRKADAIT